MIAGRYTLDREIGRGGMGAVWLGRDEVLGRAVAVKRIGMMPGGTSPDLERAEREARLAARLNHPHVVAVFDLVVDDEQQWLVMEYVEGVTLSELVARDGALTPDEASLTTTVWMAGVFNALLTQGHVSINRLLSTTRSYLSLQRAHGQRIFVEQDDGYALLDVPSAWEVSPSACRWLYAHAGGLIEVRVTAPTTRHAIELEIAVLDGPPARFLLSHHVALNGDDGAEAVPVRFARGTKGIVVRPIPDTDVGRRFPDGVFRLDPQPGTIIEKVSRDAVLFADGRSRQQPFLTVATAPAARVGFRFTGGLVAARDRGFTRRGVALLRATRDARSGRRASTPPIA